MSDSHLLSADTICEYLAISTGTLAKYRGMGLPMKRRNKYDPVAVIAWYAQHEVDKRISYLSRTKDRLKTKGDTGQSGTNAQEDLAIARTELLRLKLKEQAGLLIPIEKYHADIVAASVLFVDTMDSLGASLASELADIDEPRHILNVIFERSREYRNLAASQLIDDNFGLLAEDIKKIKCKYEEEVAANDPTWTQDI